MSLAEGLSRYLTELWGQAVEVQNLARIPGGASRETYSFDALVGDERRGLILRRDPVGSLIDTSREVEFAAYRSFFGRVPAPEPIALEAEGTALERPFFLMSRIEGGVTGSIFTPGAYGEHAETLGRELFAILGRIAGTDPHDLPLTQQVGMPPPGDCWRAALEEWEAVIERDERHPQPIVRAAIRRLRRNPPPPAQKVSVVHGDFRSGNFLHDGQGRVIAILDWEMAHLGDPLEDLAWCCDPLWGHFDESRVAGTIPLAEAIAVWERASGLTVDPEAFAWWRLFASVKGQAIWTTSAKTFAESGCADLVLGFSGYFTARRHDRLIADQLEQLVEEGWA